MEQSSVFDTLAYSKRFRAVGFTEEQADAQAEALKDLVEDNLASRRDVTDLTAHIEVVRADLTKHIEDVRAELKRDIEELRTELKRDIQELRTELKHDTEQLRAELKHDTEQLRAELKRDIAEVRREIAEVRREIAEAKADTIKWMIGLLFLQAGFIVALVKLL
jgi:uncharacterized protein YdhG (YjbR/CyaY superfamily)